MNSLSLLVTLPAILAGAVFGAGDPQAEKESLILKLSNDINKVDYSIEVTKDLIKKSPDAPYLADLYFRLAELYVERSRYVYARIVEQQPEGEGTLSGDQALEVQISKRLAIETYTRVLTDFPDYAKNDQVRFFKAHEYRELGEYETMLKDYRELVERFPKSDWAVEARLILGDHFFDKSDLEASERQYAEILALPESHIHDMARYKLAWIRINQERFREALTLFEAAIKSGRKQKTGAIGDAKMLNIKREALLAMVWPFSEVKKAYQAPDYFQKLADSKTLYIATLNKLANRYFVKTEYQNAALLYREIVRFSSDVGQNTEYLQRIYDSVRNMSARNSRRYANAANDVDAIVTTVARFQNQQAFSDEDKSKLTHDFEIRARDLATRLHVIAQRKGDKRSARVAAEAYRKYLSLFRNDKEVQEIRQNRASALYQSTQFLDAGLQYEDIARTLEDGPDRRKALYSAILGFHKGLEADATYRERKPTSDGLLNKLELLRSREGLKQLGAYYVKTWPKDKNTSNVKFNVARMYYQQGEYARSAELFRAFVEQYPTHKDMAIAGNLALDALHKLDDYDGLAALAKAFVQNKAIANNKFKAEAARIGDAARRRNVEFAVIATSDEDFSEKMLSEWQKHKGSQQGEDFLYAAFVKYKSEGNAPGVFDFGGRLVGAYPKSPRLKDVLGTMGSFAVRVADYERAAFLFEELYKRFPEGSNAADVLVSAGDIYFLLADYKKAAAVFREVRRIARGPQRRKAHERLLEVYRETRDWSALARVAQTALEEGRRFRGAAFHLGYAYASAGKVELARRELLRAVRLPARTDFDKRFVGRASFELGRLLQAEFDAVKFRDARSAEEILGIKLQLLSGMEQSYGEAVGSGSAAWGIAALHASARAYRDFGAFIAGAPLPDGVGGAEAEQYRAALQEQASPYAQKAEQTLAACAQKAEQLKVFTPFATACLQADWSAVEVVGGRQRSGVRGDDVYLQEVQRLRTQLATKPESVELLTQLAQRALSVGDPHLARMVLTKVTENQPKHALAHNLLGVAIWRMGEPQEAYRFLQKAQKNGSSMASLNLAALFFRFGYTKEARRALRAAGDINAIDMSSSGVHPEVETALTEMTSS